jgi:hypothetical protein
MRVWFFSPRRREAHCAALALEALAALTRGVRTAEAGLGPHRRLAPPPIRFMADL